MSGFFAVRAAALDADVLRPLGYKILLELIVRCRLGGSPRCRINFRTDSQESQRRTSAKGYASCGTCWCSGSAACGPA